MTSKKSKPKGHICIDENPKIISVIILRRTIVRRQRFVSRVTSKRVSSKIKHSGRRDLLLYSYVTCIYVTEKFHPAPSIHATGRITESCQARNEKTFFQLFLKEVTPSRVITKKSCIRYPFKGYGFWVVLLQIIKYSAKLVSH